MAHTLLADGVIKCGDEHRHDLVAPECPICGETWLALPDHVVVAMIEALLEYECVPTSEREARLRDRRDGVASLPAMASLVDRYMVIKRLTPTTYAVVERYSGRYFLKDDDGVKWAVAPEDENYARTMLGRRVPIVIRCRDDQFARMVR